MSATTRDGYGLVRRRGARAPGLRPALRLGPVHWTAVAPLRAARAAVGVVVPLVVGWAAVRMELGAFAALAALPAGVASFQGVSRTRVAAVVAASVGMASSTFVGATLAASAPWLLVPAVAVWGLAAGLAVGLGPRPSVAALYWAVALLLAAGLPMSAREAAIRGVLVLAGGLLQAALVAGSWVVRPGRAERAALAESLRALSRYADDVADGVVRPPTSLPLPAEEVLHDPNPLLSTETQAEYLGVLEDAERVRASIAALAERAAGDPTARSFAAHAAAVLRGMAAALRARPAERAEGAAAAYRRLARLGVPRDARWRWTGEALLGQLRAIGAALAGLEHGGSPRAHHAGLPTASPAVREPAQSRLAGVTASLGQGRGARRHAVRLAVVAALGELLVQATGLAQGQWAILTIFLVLSPDYATTAYRGAERSAGTLLGAGLGVAAAQMGHLGAGGLIGAAGLCVAAAYATFDVSFLVFSVFLTAFIVVLLEILGSPAVPTAEARIVATLIGSALALAAYVAWPTWEAASANATFARLLEAHRDYAVGLLRALTDEGGADLARLRRLQAAARIARNDAEASAARLDDEPHDVSFTASVARSLIASMSRVAHAELALHALVVTPGAERRGDEGVRAVADALDDAMTAQATALATMRPPRRIPELRAVQVAIAPGDGPIAHDLATITDELVDAVDGVDWRLRERLRCPGSAADRASVPSGAPGGTL